MGLFNKNKDKKQDRNENNKNVSNYSLDDNSSNPQIPELPKLPEFPGFDEDSSNAPANQPPSQNMNSQKTPQPQQNNRSDLPELPSFPKNEWGNKFSQNAIKDVVSGEKEDDSEEYADDLDMDIAPDQSQMMQQPSGNMQKGIMSEQQNTIPNYSQTQRPRAVQRQYPSQKTKKAEPVFIRLDKFEESVEIFENTKDQISEIEKLLKDIKETKQKEEEELSSWENEIQDIKNQIEKVDQDIFSKV